MNNVIQQWHALVDSKNLNGLDDLLAEHVVFHSPVVLAPQEGKKLTTWYLKAAFKVLFNETFIYTREIINERDAVLEFTTELKGITINGVDMIQWNDEGKMTDFKVMIRPLQAIKMVHELMGQQLLKQ